ncbi:DUF4375 domain-containing protein [bacterium]|nr:DUF4375 domain-containing protein [bacterium]
MIEQLFDPKSNFRQIGLKRFGDEAVPMLIEALEDPRTATTVFPEGEVISLDPQSPFERIVKLLSPYESEDTIEPLAGFLKNKNPRFRAKAAFAIGRLGSPIGIAPMLKALSDEEEDVRSQAIFGIGGVEKRDQRTQRFLDGVFPALAKSLDNTPSAVTSVMHPLADVLFSIDPERASEVMASVNYLNLENNRLRYFLSAFNKAQKPVPLVLLLPLLEDLRPLRKRNPQLATYEEALVSYAHNPDSKAEERIRQDLDDEYVQLGALRALAVLAGVTEIPESFEVEEPRKFPLPMQYYWWVKDYHLHVWNDGIGSFLLQRTPGQVRMTIKALKHCGAVDKAANLEEIALSLGLGELLSNEWNHLYETLDEKGNQAIDVAQKAYNEIDDEDYDLLLARYVLKNIEAFGGQNLKSKADNDHSATKKDSP